jgi:hypothetical protein
MKIIKTFEDFITEDALRAGEESKVVIDDITLDSGSTIKAAEILGAVTASMTDDEFKSYFYDSYGQAAFGEGEIDQLVKIYNDVAAEELEAEKEAEKEGEDDEEASDDPLAGL